mgnify:CR=1 FL=1
MIVCEAKVIELTQARPDFYMLEFNNESSQRMDYALSTMYGTKEEAKASVNPYPHDNGLSS